jgi:hypothetical protein
VKHTPSSIGFPLMMAIIGQNMWQYFIIETLLLLITFNSKDDLSIVLGYAVAHVIICWFPTIMAWV